METLAPIRSWRAGLGIDLDQRAGGGSDYHANKEAMIAGIAG
jgi:hypothetical protein